MNLRAGVLFSFLCISSIFSLLAQVPCANYGFEPNQDFDCDGIVNEIDIDDDNDGIPDWDESCPGLTTFEEIKYLEHFQKATLEGNTQLGNNYTRNAIAFNYTSIKGVESSATFGPFEAPENKYIKEVVIFLSRDYSTEQYPAETKIKIEFFEGKKLIKSDSLVITEVPWNEASYRIISNINSNKAIHIRISDASAPPLKNPGKSWALNSISLKTGACSPDLDNDGILNIFDRDLDNDGCSDFFEKNRYEKNDSTVHQHPQFDGVGSNGLADFLETYPDSDTLNYKVSNDISFSDSISCIDSDGDGLVNKYDLDDDNDGILDSLESCTPMTSEYGGFPNPDFEFYSSLPDRFTQMDRLDSWEQVSTATSDFYHNDGYGVKGNSHAPPTTSGKGFAGGLSFPLEVYMEYIGNNYIEPLKAGRTYSFKIELATPFKNHGRFDGFLTLYGYTSKVNFPIEELSKPITNNSFELFRVPVNVSKGTWQTEEISFTAPVDIHAIALGGEDAKERTMLLMDNIRVITCTLNDYDNDGIPNELDLDSDNDGCNDSFESGVAINNIKRVEQHPNFDSLGNNGLADFTESKPDQGGYNYDFTYYFLDSTVNNCPICLDSIPPVLIGVPEDQTLGCYNPQPFNVNSFDDKDGVLKVAVDSTIYRTGAHIDSIRYRWKAIDLCFNTAIDSALFKFRKDTFSFTLPKTDMCEYEIIHPTFIGLDTSVWFQYTWESLDTNLTITGIHDQNPSFIPLKPGSYLVKLHVENGEGCSMTNETTLQTIDNAKDAEITGEIAFCENDTILLEALQEAKIQWITPLGDTASGQTLMIPSAKLGHAGTYKAIFHFSEYCIDTAFHTIGINRSLTPAPKGPTEVCLHETLSLTVAGAGDSKYQWFYKDSLVSTDQNPTFDSERFGLGEHQLTIFVDPTVGCAGTGFFSFEVNELGEVTLPKDTSVLVNGTISLSTDGFKNVIWAGPNNFFSNTGTISFDKVTESNEGYYSYLAVTESGCQVLDSVMLKVINTDDSDTDDSDTDDSDTDDSETDDSKTDDSKTDDSETDDSETDDSETDDSKTDDSKTDDSKTDDSETDDSETDDSETDDSETDDSETDDSETDDSETDDSETDDSETDDSETDDSETDDSEIDDSETDDSETDDSETDDSEIGDSEIDDSEIDNSDTDDSDTDDSETDDSDTDDSKIITVFLDSLNKAEVCFPYDKKENEFYIQKVCGKGNGVEDIEIVNDVCLRISGSINSMQENCYTLCNNQSCESFRLQIYPYTPPLKLRKDSIVIELGKQYELILDENKSDSTQINLLYTPESEVYQINGNNLEILSSSMTCGKLDSIIYQVETPIHKDTATLYVEGECLEIIVLNGFSPNGDGINDYFIIQNIETLADNWVGIFNRNGNLVFQQKNYSNKKPWNGTFNNKKLPEGTYFYVIKTGENNTVLDGYLILNW